MRKSNRRGVALLAALTLLAVVGLLVIGGVAASVVAQRSVRLSGDDARLNAAADYALATVLGNAQAYALSDLPYGDARAFAVDVAQPGLAATVDATRLANGTVWLVADVTATGGSQGHRRINLVAAYRSLGALPPAGIVARGGVNVADDVVLRTDPAPEADCAAVAGAAIVTAAGATVRVPAGVVARTDASAGDSTTYFLSPAQVAVLDSSSRVMHVRGDTTINTGSLTGVLVVDGTLRIAGPVLLTGLVVARGAIVASSGFVVTGAVLSFAASPATAVDLSSGTVVYAPCAVARALRAATALKPVRQRSWAELF